MAIVRPDDLSTAYHENGDELTRVELEAARLLNHERAKIRHDLGQERAARIRSQGHGGARRDLWRDVLLALLTGALVATGVYAAETHRDRQFIKFSQQMEDERQQHAQRLSNTQFIRQLAVSAPNGPKPLAGLDLRNARLTGLNLSDADLSGADLTKASLYGADLTDADLEEAQLGGADLTNATLTSANLGGAHLDDAILYVAKLSGAIFSDATLTNANLDADLTDADFTHADLTGATLAGAKLVGANFTGANLTGTEFTYRGIDSDLGETDFTDVWWCPINPPRWPAGFNPPVPAVSDSHCS